MTDPEAMALEQYDAPNKSEREMLETLISSEWTKTRQLNFMVLYQRKQRKLSGQVKRLSDAVEVKRNKNTT